jgi:hypothetical protein
VACVHNLSSFTTHTCRPYYHFLSDSFPQYDTHISTRPPVPFFALDTECSLHPPFAERRCHALRRRTCFETGESPASSASAKPHRSSGALRSNETLSRPAQFPSTKHTRDAHTDRVFRRTSQKPSDELYKNFKANFPALGASTSPSSSNPPQPAASLTDPLDAAHNPQ